jgi:hypothetical protein
VAIKRRSPDIKLLAQVGDDSVHLRGKSMPQVTGEADVAKQHRRFKNENHTIESSRDEIETNSQDSFPASDAPSWTPITRIGSPHRN